MDHKDLLGQNTDTFKSTNKIEISNTKNTKLDISSDFQHLLQR